MWFNNALVFHYELNQAVDLAEKLREEMLKPCPPHARFIYGWVPVLADELVQEVAGASLFCLGKEERILPKSVVKRAVEERVQSLERQQDRTIRRAEKAQLAEDIEFELLPKSFCIQKRLPAILDSAAKRLIINTASANQISQLTALLRKSLPEIHLEPFAAKDNLAQRFVSWINNPGLLPNNFKLASDCLLFNLDDEKKRINCKGYELPAEEILSLLSQGLVAAEISLIWNERIQLTLTQDLTFKRLKSLDYLVDEFNDIKSLEDEYQQRDALFMLVCGELRNLMNDLLLGLEETAAVSLSKIEEQEALYVI